MFQDSLTRELVPVRGTSAPAALGCGDPERQATIRELLPYYRLYIENELRQARWTVVKYTDNMRLILKVIGDIPPGRIAAGHVLALKTYCASRNVGPSRVASLVATLKSFLNFCRMAVGLDTLDPKQIRGPRIPKRDVVFLTPEEVRQFVAAIPVRKNNRAFDMKWLCFRTLVEVLLGTGMRISEALSLRRSSINLQTGEASIIGKGNKERTVFFSARALNWVKEYLTRRTDHQEALFLDAWGHPLRLETVLIWFRRFRKLAGIKKKVTAHILRHTVATTLLFNGCPIGHIKEILGHEHLVTTCKFYLGADKRAARDAHQRYLDYDGMRDGSSPDPVFERAGGSA